MLEGVDAGMAEAEETEEMGQNLSVSVVLKKQSTIKYELRKIGGGACATKITTTMRPGSK